MTTYTIKPLAWEQDGCMYIADTPFGQLCVFQYEPDLTFRARYHHKYIDWIGHKHESLEAAKQACAEHWEGMIRQALEVCDG